MNSKDRFKLFIFMYCLMFFLFVTVLLGFFLITEGVHTELLISFIICGVLLLLTIYFFVGFVKKSSNKEYIYLTFKTAIAMLILATIFIGLILLTQNPIIAVATLILLSLLIALYMLKETREKEIYVEFSKVCCSYKNIKVFESKNRTEDVKVGDKLNGPVFRMKKLWKVRTKKSKVVGYVYRPDIMADLKRRKIEGINSFTVSKFDAEGNIYVDIDVYISKYRALNAGAAYDKSLEKTSFILDTNKEPAKSVTITRPTLKDKSNINSKCTLQSKEVILNESFENVKVINDGNFDSNVFDNEKLEIFYDENDTILLMSNFNQLPVGQIDDQKVKSLIKSYNDFESLIRISVQKIESNAETGKTDIYVRVLFYKN